MSPLVFPAFPAFLFNCAAAPALALMFATLIRLITGRPPPGLDDNLFVEAVRVHDPAVRRDPRTVRFIFVCWVLIAAKHVLVIWACENYRTPFHQLWVNFPTWLLGALATGIYFWRTRRR